MGAACSGFISVLRPSERLSVLQGALRWAAMEGRVWGGGGRWRLEGLQTTAADAEILRGSAMRGSQMWRRRSLQFSDRRSAAPPSQRVRVPGWMDGWRTLSPPSLQVLLLILILKSPKHKVLSLSSLIEQVYRHGCNHVCVCIYPPPRLLAQRWGRHDGQAPLSSRRTLACGQSPSPRVAVSVIHSSRRPPCCLLANAAMTTARHVTNREVTGLTVEGREGQSFQMCEPSCSSSRLPPGLLAKIRQAPHAC